MHRQAAPRTAAPRTTAPRQGGLFLAATLTALVAWQAGVPAARA